MLNYIMVENGFGFGTHSYAGMLLIHFVLCMMTIELFWKWGLLCVVGMCSLVYGFDFNFVGEKWDIFGYIVLVMCMVNAWLNWGIFVCWCVVLLVSLGCVGFRRFRRFSDDMVPTYCLCMNEIMCIVFFPVYAFRRSLVFFVWTMYSETNNIMVIVTCVGAIWLSFLSPTFCMIVGLFVIVRYVLILKVVDLICGAFSRKE